MRIDAIPLGDRLRLFLARPRWALRYFHLRLVLASPLPGETFMSLSRDMRARCLGVDGDTVVLELRSGLYLHRYGSDWDSLPEGAIADVVRVDRREFARGSWQPG